MTGCINQRVIRFAAHSWTVNEDFGQLINSDTTYRFTVGERLIPVDMPIICSQDSVNRYPGMKEFIYDILHTAGLDSSEILFYAPAMQLMFVKVNDNFEGIRPYGVTSDLREPSKLITFFTSENNPEHWKRQPMEMHTYSYLTKNKKQFLVVDIFDYGDEEIAHIQVNQTKTKSTDKMRIPFTPFYTHDITDMNHLLLWSSVVDWHKSVAVANYQIGNEVKVLRDKKAYAIYTKLITRADSCWIRGNSVNALEYFKDAFKFYNHIRPRDVYNAACAATEINDTATAIALLKSNIMHFPSWYFSIEADKDFNALHEHYGWKEIVDSMSARSNRAEIDFDRPLKARLERIFKSDQNVRYRFIKANGANPRDSVLVDSILTEMREVDRQNLAEIKDIIAANGWVGKDKVGSACTVIWLIIQHSDINTQKEMLPIFRSAVATGDLDASSVAMLEDRIMVAEGKPQIYGTQLHEDENGNLIPHQLQSPEQVDDFRRQVGLPPLSEYLKDMQKKYGK